jgi:hypothetical protein
MGQPDPRRYPRRGRHGGVDARPTPRPSPDAAGTAADPASSHPAANRSGVGEHYGDFADWPAGKTLDNVAYAFARLVGLPHYRWLRWRDDPAMRSTGSSTALLGSAAEGGGGGVTCTATAFNSSRHDRIRSGGRATERRISSSCAGPCPPGPLCSSTRHGGRPRSRRTKGTTSSTR